MNIARVGGVSPLRQNGDPSDKSTTTITPITPKDFEKWRQTVRTKHEESESIDIDNIFNNMWNQLSYKRGSKQSANASWVKHAQDQKPEFLIEKYNALCSQTDDPQFIPHFSTWINQERWDEELPHKHKDRDVFSMSKEEKKSETDKIYSKIGIKKEINDE